MACTDGSLTYCSISSRATNAKSIATIMFEVVRIITLGYLKHKHIFMTSGLLLQKFYILFMFCWPRISIYSCKENQLEALFILSIFHQSTSTCFRHIYSPPSVAAPSIYTIGSYSSFSFVALVRFQPNQDNRLYYKHARNM